MPDCSSLQRSLAWCQGRPELPGVRRRIYYISKYDILKWPTLPHDANGRLIGSAYQGDFTLRADASWKFIDIIPDKSQLTSDPQGEYPSQTQLNKLVAVHPSVGAEASAAAAYLNNNDNVFLVEDMKGAFRVVGSDKWQTKTTVAQDLGQGAAGSASTTINVEASDECPAPFYSGRIVTDDGTTSGTAVENNTGGYNGGGNNGGNNSGNTGGNSSTPASYNNTVTINGSSKSVSGGSVSITGPLKSLSFSGSNMLAIFVKNGSNESEANISSNKSSASWSGNIASGTVRVTRWNGTEEDPQEVNWFTINVTAASSGGNTGGSTGGNTGGSTDGGGVAYTAEDGATYNKNVTLNGNQRYPVSKDGRIVLRDTLKSISVSGTNMHDVRLMYVDSAGKAQFESFTISSDKKSATWTGSIEPRESVYVKCPDGNTANPKDITWFTIEVLNQDDEWWDEN